MAEHIPWNSMAEHIPWNSMAEHIPWNCNVFTKQQSNEMAMAKCQCNNHCIKINLLKPGSIFTYCQVEQISVWC